MKKILLTLFLCALIHCMGANEIKWLTDYQVALETARKEQKPLLLFFTGSDWCALSMKLKKEILDSVEFAEASGDQFVFVEIDFPLYSNQSKDLVEQNTLLKEQNQVHHFPTIALLDVKQRLIAKCNYLPENGKKYAQTLIEKVKRDEQLTQFMSQSELYSQDFKMIKKFYKRAVEFGRENEANQLLELGLKATDNLFFLTEKYRHLVDYDQDSTSQALALRDQLLSSDPNNEKKTHFFIALTDFEILSKKIKPGIDLGQIVAPLKKYIERFGKQDSENVWRLEMMMAQFFYEYDEPETALAHAEIAFKSAPDVFKSEIKRSMDYMKAHSS